jgi:hypothetical protein
MIWVVSTFLTLVWIVRALTLGIPRGQWIRVGSLDSSTAFVKSWYGRHGRWRDSRIHLRASIIRLIVCKPRLFDLDKYWVVLDWGIDYSSILLACKKFCHDYFWERELFELVQ